MSSCQPMIGEPYGCALKAIDATSSPRNPPGSSSVRVRRSSMTTWRSDSISLGSSRRLCIRSELDHEVELVGGDVDEVRGDVLGGERVVLTAVLLDEPRELAAPVGRRALEHHVLEEVRDAGRSAPLVARADPVPDLKRDDRAPVVLQEDHPQPVVECLGDDGVRGPGRWTAEKEREEEDDESPSHWSISVSSTPMRFAALLPVMLLLPAPAFAEPCTESFAAVYEMVSPRSEEHT